MSLIKTNTLLKILGKQAKKQNEQCETTMHRHEIESSMYINAQYRKKSYKTAINVLFFETMVDCEKIIYGNNLVARK